MSRVASPIPRRNAPWDDGPLRAEIGTGREPDVRRGLRREFVPDHTGASLNAIWIGDIPVSHRDSRWLYELVNDADKRGLLHLEYKPGGQAIYLIPHDTTRILAVSRRRGRPIPSAPGALHDARSGQIFPSELQP